MGGSIFEAGPRTARQTAALAALALLGGESSPRLTPKSLSAAAGLAPDALRRLFPDEAGILRYLLKETGLALERKLDKVEAESGGGASRLLGFLEAHFRLVEEHPGLANLLYRPASPRGGPDAAPDQERLQRRFLARLEKTVALGREAREFRREIDPAMAAMHFIGLIRMAIAFWELGDRGARLMDLGRPLWEQFLEGIKA